MILRTIFVRGDAIYILWSGYLDGIRVAIKLLARRAKASTEQSALMRHTHLTFVASFFRFARHGCAFIVLKGLSRRTNNILMMSEAIKETGRRSKRKARDKSKDEKQLHDSE
ncbi:hypothetical protein COZ26_01050 [Candidatus Kuenenbacteria bacterium CG_4_10_14_3_um_filter_39_14]|uniref:Uncharacterized protein n=1 Tax=Candidatus Kuenenbacteria bacterium CG_4_10_14_3_um_filter_39_14 TaxID=1974614 RepID=A0A2M7MHK3_9BACT|nr:MAG: hypothetical protein COZ26_01050 [Candidatus Kuenenbacteria bacterium CG_4_10_14_3_um_filter_39_14]